MRHPPAGKRLGCNDGNVIPSGNSGFRLILSRREEKWQCAVNGDNVGRETLGSVLLRSYRRVMSVKALDNVDENLK